MYQVGVKIRESITKAQAVIGKGFPCGKGYACGKGYSCGKG